VSGRFSCKRSPGNIIAQALSSGNPTFPTVHGGKQQQQQQQQQQQNSGPSIVELPRSRSWLQLRRNGRYSEQCETDEQGQDGWFVFFRGASHSNGKFNASIKIIKMAFTLVIDSRDGGISLVCCSFSIF